jgi:hypothetical protein
MRPRTEALLGVATLTALATIASLLGHSYGPAAATANSLVPSTFLTDPGGARGLLEATQRLGIDVLRFRDRPNQLTKLQARPRQIFVILNPQLPVSAPDIPIILRFHRSADLLLAGPWTENLMRCFGYVPRYRLLDSVRVDGRQASAPFVHATLARTSDSIATDSTRARDVGRVTCKVPRFTSVHTLLGSPRGPVVVRLEEEDGRHVILVADASLLANQSLRETDAGPFALALFAGEYDHVVFDEYHHGYGASGSMLAATLAWSTRSPLGWAGWQLIGAGVLALLAGAIRFGPPLPGIPRRRRSPLEHVRALATALAAAHGHDQAIAAIVRGLRRRLSPVAMGTRGDWRSWLAQRTARANSPDERAALTTLSTLTQPGQPRASVLQAADTVEDLWQSLQH